MPAVVLPNFYHCALPKATCLPDYHAEINGKCCPPHHFVSPIDGECWCHGPVRRSECFAATLQSFHSSTLPLQTSNGQQECCPEGFWWDCMDRGCKLPINICSEGFHPAGDTGM